MLGIKEVVDIDKKTWYVDIMDENIHLLRATGKGMSISSITMDNAINSDKYNREDIMNELYNVLKGVYETIEAHYYADNEERRDVA